MTERRGAVCALGEVLEWAVVRNVPDVHVEPGEGAWQVQFRRNGRLCRVAAWDEQTGLEIVRRVKLLSRMDIAEKRVPQDGQLQLPVAGEVRHMRVATLPTVRGERLVIRIHDARMDPDDMAAEEADDPVWRRWLSWSEAPHGLLLIAGPTGSGKTTSLYRTTRRWAEKGYCVISLEDPVERHIPGVHQVDVMGKRGLTYRRLLPASLRQDPNALAIGEIRDDDAAWTAVQAALAGCIVVATLHAAGPGDVWRRFGHWGICPGELENSLLAVLSQRLAPRLCPHCRRRKGAVRGGGGRVALAWTAAGCDLCGGRGRSGVVPVYHLSEQGRESGQALLPDWEESAWPKVVKGDLGEEWYGLDTASPSASVEEV
ncbi:MAG: ATPase, T2SS/T4P/T4SS family [Kyrpidia sp.]|nr:ATPase, T2SS/T4P/T4SS family [Kyrpidia sp.]